jgi:hypothetical protein
MRHIGQRVVAMDETPRNDVFDARARRELGPHRNTIT